MSSRPPQFFSRRKRDVCVYSYIPKFRKIASIVLLHRYCRHVMIAFHLTPVSYLISRHAYHSHRPSGLLPPPLPADLTACTGFPPCEFCELPTPASPRGLPPVATRGPPTPTASLMLLPYPATPCPHPRVRSEILHKSQSQHHLSWRISIHYRLLLCSSLTCSILPRYNLKTLYRPGSLEGKRTS